MTIWGVAVPLLGSVALIYHHTPWGDGLRGLHSEHLAFLTHGYRDGAAWWEIVSCVQKLTLVGFLSLYEPGSLMQLVVALVVALALFAFQLFLQPYQTEADGQLAHVASLALLLVLLGSFVIQAQTLVPEELFPDDGPVSAVVLLVIALGLVGSYGLLLSLLLVTGASLQRERAAVACWLRVRETGLVPELSLAHGKRWHVFLSHSWDNQDAVATIKRQLQLMLPGVLVFLDTDDLQSIDELEAYVEASQACLIMHGSAKCTHRPLSNRHSAAFSGNRRPSVPIGGNQWQSAASLSRAVSGVRAYRSAAPGPSFLS